MRSILSRFMQRFLQMEAASGLTMLAAAVFAMVLANSKAADWYYAFLQTPLIINITSHVFLLPLQDVVKDMLMTFFFWLVGLELKREMTEGVFTQKDQLWLPLVAAFGGMVFPCLIYFAWNSGHPAYLAGWAIPAATDIAFALCALHLAGRAVPPSAKIFLLAIAIFDDLGAILIIACFYGHNFHILAFVAALAGILVLFLCHHKKISYITPYVVLGIYLWICLYNAGIHPTLAGILIGLFMPMHSRNASKISPVKRCMDALHPWVGFIILPAFAFVNSGISLLSMQFSMFSNTVTLGIISGLFFGKQIGIFLPSFLLVRYSKATLPAQMGWLQLYAIAAVAGIGFTMSFLIGDLALPNALQDHMRLGVILGSSLSFVYGILVWKVLALKRGQKHPLRIKEIA